MKNVNDINEYIELVENSKIILHIYAKDMNHSFDYYRLSLLYSNKVFVISETYKEVNPENSHKLEELSKVLIESNYDDLSNKTEEYLNKSTSEIDTITQQTYDVFKKNTLDESIIKFFSEHI